jgi:secreted PhoX family phosphatase
MSKEDRYPGPWTDDGEADVLPGTPARPAAAEPIQSVIDRTISRRSVLKGAAFLGATMVVGPSALLGSRDAEAGWGKRGGRWDRLRFDTVPPGNEPDVVVPPNYEVDVILRWGDPLTKDAPAFDVNNQTGEAQAQQFGFNADLVLWYPLPEFVEYSVREDGQLGELANQGLGVAYPALKETFSRKALMVVNHEYTKAVDMFPDFDPATYPTLEQTRVEIEAHGFSIVELKQRRRGEWEFNPRSPFNRRATGSTLMDITGPLRGSPMMQAENNPSGTEVRGSLNNCAGGKTPWGTILTCEENFDQYFANFSEMPDEIRALSERIPAPSGGTGRGWEKHVGRFDLALDPKEYNRFGYVVEVDPYDPSSRPKKRTALGRFKHEAAAASVAKDGRVAIYSGDDARFEYAYKFVSSGVYNPADRESNLGLLDDGVLYVARFDAGEVEGDDMGTGEWLELSPSNPALAGWTLEEILLNTRGAADVLGATPMDRPEDVEVSPLTGNVFIALTNNSRRDGEPGDTRIVNGREVSSAPNEANPRNDTYDDGDATSNTGNQHGHVIELIEDFDSASLSFRWNILVKCGDPSVPAHQTSFGDIEDPVAAGVSPISDPDNLVHDDDGNLWIATDGQFFSGSAGFGQNDGVFAVPVVGENRGLLRQFLSGVPGGEVCGPEFSGDNRTFFCAIQHPNDGNAFELFWPLDEAFKDGVSKPSLIAVREKRGRKIGY